MRQALFSGASNGFADHSPAGFAFWAVVITEVVFTALFILVIAGTTRSSAIAGFAGIPIGLMLALVHMISIPIDNTSVNPARSFSTALYSWNFADWWALKQLWVFILFPIIGGLIGAGHLAVRHHARGRGRDGRRGRGALARSRSGSHVRGRVRPRCDVGPGSAAGHRVR